jgi:hypothetical protein
LHAARADDVARKATTATYAGVASLFVWPVGFLALVLAVQSWQAQKAAFVPVSRRRYRVAFIGGGVGVLLTCVSLAVLWTA